MTIKDYLEEARKMDEKYKFSDGSKYSEAVAKTTNVWDNDACRGYLIEAAKRLKMSREKILSLLEAVDKSFNYYTQDEAAKIYYNF